MDIIIESYDEFINEDKFIDYQSSVKKELLKLGVSKELFNGFRFENLYDGDTSFHYNKKDKPEIAAKAIYKDLKQKYK